MTENRLGKRKRSLSLDDRTSNEKKRRQKTLTLSLLTRDVALGNAGVGRLRVWLDNNAKMKLDVKMMDWCDSSAAELAVISDDVNILAAFDDHSPDLFDDTHYLDIASASNAGNALTWLLSRPNVRVWTSTPDVYAICAERNCRKALAILVNDGKIDRASSVHGWRFPVKSALQHAIRRMDAEMIYDLLLKDADICDPDWVFSSLDQRLAKYREPKAFRAYMECECLFRALLKAHCSDAKEHLEEGNVPGDDECCVCGSSVQHDYLLTNSHIRSQRLRRSSSKKKLK